MVKLPHIGYIEPISLYNGKHVKRTNNKRKRNNEQTKHHHQKEQKQQRSGIQDCAKLWSTSQKKNEIRRCVLHACKQFSKNRKRFLNKHKPQNERQKRNDKRNNKQRNNRHNQSFAVG